MNQVIKPPTANFKRHQHFAFTLTELLVVIVIITVLVGILIPVVSSVQKSSKEASSRASMVALIAAIEAYYSDFKAYPGPLSDQEIYTDPGAGPVIVNLATGAALVNSTHITGTENLVLGIVGGLRRGTGTPPPIIYDRDALDSARGAGSLNTAQPKLYKSYISTAALYKGIGTNYSDESGPALDSPIPEFLDSFNSPMPVLYLRPARGKAVTAANNVVSITTGTAVATTPYDLRYIVGYVGTATGGPGSGAGSSSIGVGKDLPEYFQGDAAMPTAKSKVTPFPYHGLRSATATAVLSANAPTAVDNYFLPYDAYPYFRDPSTATLPVGDQRARKNDSYILISAGKDRVYGTDDDITNFGNVSP